MNELETLSEEELIKLIKYKKMQMKHPDYSKQYKRTSADVLRDLAYGGIHGLFECGELLGNITTGGHTRDIPGWNKLIPWEEKMIESVKSPYPSPGGQLAQTIGEFAIPEAGAATAGCWAIKKWVSKLWRQL